MLYMGCVTKLKQQCMPRKRVRYDKNYIKIILG